jgi:hypothetical protein
MTSGKPTRKGGKTRRRRISPSTIPELKRSFDALEHSVADIVRAGGSQKEKVRKFQEAWRRIFGRPVEAGAAEAYLQVKARSVKMGGRTRKAKSQHGGAAALAGAPLDFQTRPGVDGVHGSFPPYITQGFGFYNTVNQDSMFKDCGRVDITPNVAADMGSNQAGGGISDAIATLTGKPVVATSPPSALQDALTSWQGRQLGASPYPDQNPLKYI